MPPLDYVWVKTEFYEYPITNKYFLSLYHSVLMLTGNDLGPRGDHEIILISAAIVIGAIINAHIFGELAVIISDMNRVNTEF